MFPVTRVRSEPSTAICGPWFPTTMLSATVMSQLISIRIPSPTAYGVSGYV